MGDAGSERSKAPSLPPRCPCGFWGSSKTMNLCSKCFADFQKKQPDDDSTPSTSNSQSDLFSGETNSDNSNTSLTTATVNSNQPQLSTELNVTSPSKEECGPCMDTAHVSLTTPTKRSCDSDSQSESEASPVKRPRLLDNPQLPEETSRSKQKSRRRCFQCQTKLELVQQELGSCRCGYVFCMLHRLPEQHDCTFDHMGRGREEAIMKMLFRHREDHNVTSLPKSAPPRPRARKRTPCFSPGPAAPLASRGPSAVVTGGGPLTRLSGNPIGSRLPFAKCRYLITHRIRLIHSTVATAGFFEPDSL
uniref:AN1-type zinc finger protein 3 n=1 Tax=Ornithorhynchus anatinus TaxID=9258 RepID=A0A6I8PGV0_ORNAN